MNVEAVAALFLTCFKWSAIVFCAYNFLLVVAVLVDEWLGIPYQPTTPAQERMRQWQIERENSLLDLRAEQSAHEQRTRELDASFGLGARDPRS